MKIGKTKVDVVSGDITKIDVDAMINPANDMLWTGGGISAIIRKAAGDSIETEAMSHAPAKIGSTVATGAGKLNARWILHAVITGQDLSTTEQAIRNAVRSSLLKAGELACKSIAVPLLDNTGHDIEVHIAVKIAVDEAVDFLIEGKHSLERLVFVEHDDTLKGLFDTALHDKFTRH